MRTSTPLKDLETIKKLPFLSIVFTLAFFWFNQSSQAQNTQPYGYNATWNYDYRLYDYRYGYMQIAYEKDTLINGLNWQFFKITGFGRLRTSPTNIVENPLNSSMMLHTRNDSVFREKNGQPEFVFYREAQVGYRWTIAPYDTSFNCMDSAIATVTAVGFDTINGHPFKYIEFSENQNPPSKYFSGNRYYVDFGMFTFNELYQPGFNMCHRKTQTLLSMHWLRCFDDGTKNFNLTNNACDYYSQLSTNDYGVPQLEVFPNPSNGYLNIKGSLKMQAIRIVNAAGTAVFEQDLPSVEAHQFQHNFPAGFYTIQIMLDNGHWHFEKLVVQ
jgi:hypothetical protein